MRAHTQQTNILELFYSHTETKLWKKPCLFRNTASLGKETKSHPALCYPAENNQITLPGATNSSAH